MTPQLVVADLVAYLLKEMDRNPSVMPKFSRLSDVRDIWQSLLFCILSSQVRTQAAARAVSSLMAEVPFVEQKLSSVDVYARARTILRRDDVRYRFPDVRSRQIAESWFAFAQIKDDFYGYLESHSTEDEARLGIAQRFSGLGFKQASMFLRDVGYSSRLCIIDTHLLWYCAQMGNNWHGMLTPKKYIEIERYLLDQSDKLGVAPNAFDSAIWVAVTTFKARQCTMRFA